MNNRCSWKRRVYLSVKGYCKTMVRFAPAGLQTSPVKVETSMINKCMMKTPGFSERSAIYCLSLLEATGNTSGNYFVISQTHTYAHKTLEVGDRFIEAINSKIISFRRHELGYKRLARFIPRKMFSALSTVGVMCSMCVNSRLNCSSRWAGIITRANAATRPPRSALPPR